MSVRGNSFHDENLHEHGEKKKTISIQSCNVVTSGKVDKTFSPKFSRAEKF